MIEQSTITLDSLDFEINSGDAISDEVVKIIHRALSADNRSNVLAERGVYGCCLLGYKGVLYTIYKDGTIVVDCKNSGVGQIITSCYGNVLYRRIVTMLQNEELLRPVEDMVSDVG